MSNPKQLGAEAMFDQSIVYLYNSYREEGYTPEKSSEIVAKKIEEVYTKYAHRGLIKPKPVASQFMIEKLNTLISDANALKAKTKGQIKFEVGSLLRGLIYVQSHFKK